MTEPSLLDWQPSGQTLSHALDSDRLRSQLRRVRFLMLDGNWRDLGAIAHACAPATEASVSARLRDLRKRGYLVEKRRDGDPKKGHWVYRVVPNESFGASRGEGE